MRISVRYPLGRTDRLVLRTAVGWTRDVLPEVQGHDTALFDVPFDASFLALKPCLWRGGEFHWAKGSDLVLGAHDPDPEIWPFFFSSEQGSVSEVLRFPREASCHAVRVYLPAGYHENTGRTYPVLYMQDGRNLFLPDEAYGGQEWHVDETMDRLDDMNAVRKAIVVGIAPTDRLHDYTLPGYADYGAFLVQVVKPAIDARFRTRRAPAETVVMGSSLGGVVSFYLAWQYPEVFGGAACLSSTFGYGDDLFERVATEPRRPIRVYLDSGWPRDNFDATNALRDLLVHRGWRLGDDLLQFSFPEAQHAEGAWAGRIHVPFQFFFGRAWAAGRARSPSGP